MLKLQGLLDSSVCRVCTLRPLQESVVLKFGALVEGRMLAGADTDMVKVHVTFLDDCAGGSFCRTCQPGSFSELSGKCANHTALFVYNHANSLLVC